MSIRGFRLLLFAAVVSAIAAFTLAVPPKVMAANATLTVSLHEGSATGPKVTPQGVSVTATHAGTGAMPTPITLTLQGQDYVWTTAQAPDTCVRITDVACTFFVTARNSQGQSIGATIVAVAAGNNTGSIVVPAAPTTGTLRGTVTIQVPTDPPQSRPMLEGSTVTATNTATNTAFTYRVTSQAGGPALDGSYVLTGLPPGTYNIVFEGTYSNYPLSSPPIKNFRETRSGVTINAGDNTLDARNLSGTSGDDSIPQRTCGSANESMSWFFCGVIQSIQKAITGFDTQILCLLKINTGKIFNDNTGTEQCWGPQGNTNAQTAQTSASYRGAWSILRNIALALLVIFALAMVASQILGLDMLDAYTIRKLLPRLIVAVIVLTLSWNLMQFLFTMSNVAADGIRDLITYPFKTLDQTIGTSAFTFTLGYLVTGLVLTGAAGAAVAGAALLGLGGILALVGSALLGVFSAWILLVARDVVATLLIIAAPVAIICAAFEPVKKVYTAWKTVLLTILLSVPVVAAMLALTHVGALVSMQNDNDIAAIIILVSGYFLIWAIFKKIDQITGQLGNIASRATGGLQKRLADYRSNQMKNRSRVWQEGSLFNKESALGGLMNSVGRRVGYGRAISAETGKGGMKGFGLRRKGANAEARAAGLAMYDAVTQSRREKGEFQSEIANNDDANAVLAGTRGAESRLEEAAIELFGAGEATRARREAAIAGARAIGVNQVSSMTAFRTMMKNKARAVTPGNVRWMEETARGLTNSEAEYQRLANDAAFWARSNGRMDLGGTSFIGSGTGGRIGADGSIDTTQRSVGADGHVDMTSHYVGESETYTNARNAYQAARAEGDNHAAAERRAWQVVTDANMIDGFGRVPPGAIEGAHDNTIIQAAETYSRILASPTAGTHEKMQAAMGLKEMHSSKIASSGTGRDELNTALDSLGIDMAQSIDQQLADRVGIVGLTGEQLVRQARAYQDISYGGQQMVAGPDGTPIPLPVRPPVGFAGGATGVPAGTIITPAPGPSNDPVAKAVRLGWKRDVLDPNGQPESVYQFLSRKEKELAPAPPPPPSRISIVEPPRTQPGYSDPPPNAAGKAMESVKSGRATIPPQDGGTVTGTETVTRPDGTTFTRDVIRPAAHAEPGYDGFPKDPDGGRKKINDTSDPDIDRITNIPDVPRTPSP